MQTKEPFTTGIIGAGIAGIAAAIRLAKRGHKVTVFESNKYPGGKLSEVRHDGFRFDAGPSLFTMPHLVDELFTLCGEESSAHFKYKKLQVNCEYFFEDGTRIHGYAEPEIFAKEIASKTSATEKSILESLNRSALLYNLLSKLFMERSLHKAATFFNKDAFRAYRNLHKMGFFSSMHQANASRFDDEKVVQLFDRFATYNGSNPYKAPATLQIIPHLEFNIGAFFPIDGMYAITDSLYQLATRQGVTFHFNSKVEGIIVEKEQAKGLVVNQQNIYFDHIVSNMDMVNTYKKLLPPAYTPQKLLTQEKSSSALIFYWGIKKEFPELDLHNIFFSKEYKKEFQHIFSLGDIYEDPTVYINITAKEKPSDAPSGCENWFVMINVPNNQGQDWDSLIQIARRRIIEKLSRILEQPIEPLIISESTLDPRSIESKTSSALGALYGNSSNNKYAAFLRHANFSSRVKHLYFCGGSVHPGGGIPLSILSAKIVSEVLR